jgi:hypothetical protein
MFERFDFRPAYEIEVDPELPGDGDWHAHTFFFDRDNTVSQSSGDSRWGAPLLIRATVEQERWVGTFTAGIDGVRGVFATPTHVVSVVLLPGSPMWWTSRIRARERSWHNGRL